ncbi:MAG: hypothetical protein ACI8W8_000486 [Rhodothermales bacterium]|jgi:hypothetical protein
MKTLALTLLALAASAAPPAEFAYRKTLSFPETDNPILAVPLDAEVYARCREDLADLRLRNAEQGQVPYHLERQTILKKHIQMLALTSAVTELQQLPDNSLEFTLTRKSKEQAAELRISTHLQDFEHQVEIAVREGDDWRVIVAEALIFDYTRFYDLRQLTVPIPAHSGSVYRVRVSNITDELRSPHRTLTLSKHNDGKGSSSETQVLETRPFRIEHVSLWHRELRTEEQPKILRHEITADSAVVDPESNETHVLVDSQRQPITQFEIITEATNWSRKVIVEQPSEQGWRILGQSNCSRIDLPGSTSQSLRVTIPETRSSRYRLRILNRDNPPLLPDDIAAFGPGHQLVLLSRDAPTELLYSARFATAAKYDIANVLNSLRATHRPVVCELAAESANAEFAAPTGWRHWLNDGRALTYALVIMVVLLGFGLFRGAKRMEAVDTHET